MTEADSGRESMSVGPADVGIVGARQDSPEGLFKAHFPSLCRTAFLVVGDADLAEELVMEAFARTLPRWNSVQRADQPLAYLRRAVVNLSVSRVRRLSVERRARARAAESESLSWDAALAEDTRAVLGALRHLPNRQRACVVLRYFDDLAEADIARLLGCSVGTVKSQLSKGRARLAGLLGPSDREA
jgi:RNA polymerase sigma-70 factor (sigma-E family)